MSSSSDTAVAALSPTGRWIVLAVALLGWFGAGIDMALTQLAGRAAMVDLLEESGRLDAKRFQELNRQFGNQRRNATSARSEAASPERIEFNRMTAEIGDWTAWFNCAFLFGAAAGGLLIGWVGDRYGRARGMAVSILTYSGMAGVGYFAQSPEQMLAVWFLACLGVGGIWPNGVAVLSEAWSSLSRSMISGVMGTAANVGLLLMNTLATWKGFDVTPEHWRWTMLVAASPVVLGLFAWFFVPESPRWLALQRNGTESATGSAAKPVGLGEVFRSPYTLTTLTGIALATIPMMGGWAIASWMQPWAAQVGEAADPPDPALQARVGQARALPGTIGSLLGGWIAMTLGRRRTYFLVSLGAFGAAEMIYARLLPTDGSFLIWVGALGFFSGIYYGWLPLCLPELFPSRVRSSGAGVSFNFGRIITAILLLFAAKPLLRAFDGDYARVGSAASVVFALGLVVVLAIPRSSEPKSAE